MQQHVEGMYQALLEGRFLFDFVHEEKLTPQELSKYSALVLPNVALLSDEQCGQLARVRRVRRIAARDVPDRVCTRNATTGDPDFGLGDLFGIRATGDPIGTTGNAYLARIEKPHAILDGFAGTSRVARCRVSVAHRAGRGTGADGRARVRGLPARALVSRALADD